MRTIVYHTGHSVTYEPDAVDPALIGSVMLDAVQPLATDITYEPFGPVSSMTLGNGITMSRGYDRNYQLISQTSSVIGRASLPDNVGNIKAIIDNLDPDRIQTFDYDELYRLTDAIGVHGAKAFTYDKVGNRLTRTKTNGVNESDTYSYYPGTNRLHTITGTHAELFEYDADGNTIARTPGASNPNPPVSEPSDYLYNASGQSTVYHYDLSGRLIAETDTAGNLIKAYVWLHGQPLAQITADGSVYYYQKKIGDRPRFLRVVVLSITIPINTVSILQSIPFGCSGTSTVAENLKFKPYGPLAKMDFGNGIQTVLLIL